MSLLQNRMSSPALHTHPHRDASLVHLLARIDRMLNRATEVSTRFTRWRLAIFLIGAVASVTLFQQHRYQTGNMALVSFLTVFIIVARYHSKLEDRTQRLRAWRRIKAAHLARLRLDWTGIPPRPSPLLDQHPYAVDLDLIGPHSLL